MFRINFLIIFVISTSTSFKLENLNFNENPETSADLFEGDIVIDSGRGRNGITRENLKWPKNNQGFVIVPYEFQPNQYTTSEVNLMISSFNDIARISCIRFVPRTTEIDFIQIVNNAGCSSYVGRIGRMQRITLASPKFGGHCMFRGIIIHEALHALGFWHMQSAVERDQFVRINFANISPGREHNFQTNRESSLFNTPYDIRSILHYGATYFSENGQPTIEPVDRSIPLSALGQRIAMTEGDIKRLNSLYQC